MLFSFFARGSRSTPSSDYMSNPLDLVTLQLLSNGPQTTALKHLSSQLLNERLANLFLGYGTETHMLQLILFIFASLLVVYFVMAKLTRLMLEFT